jgi:hypothetical protein
MSVPQYIAAQVGSAVNTYAATNIPGVAAGALKQVGGFLRYSNTAFRWAVVICALHCQVVPTWMPGRWEALIAPVLCM